mmetsp:Transcript_48050/g.150793  ORF Transcript_48050/g.150793 Transcript_48050/m.150793 type:complete len:261 (-) Transcript_48050:145-927(-)
MEGILVIDLGDELIYSGHGVRARVFGPMEPSLYRHPRLFRIYLLHRMERQSWLHLEHGQRVEDREDHFARLDLRDPLSSRRVQLQRPSVLLLPLLIGRGEVNDVGDFPSPDHVVVTQQVATRRVQVGRAVHLVRQFPAARHLLYELPELLRVDGLTKRYELRQLLRKVHHHSVPAQVRQVAGLVHFEKIALLQVCRQVVDKLVVYRSQPLLRAESLDEAVRIGPRCLILILERFPVFLGEDRVYDGAGQCADRTFYRAFL